MTPNRKHIEKLVKERGWTDSELARQMGISRAEANRFMKGQRTGGKKLIAGLLKAFPGETLERLFVLPSVSPSINTNQYNSPEKRSEYDLVPVKNLNNALVAKMDVRKGLIEVAEHGYLTQFKVPAGTDIKVTHYLLPGKPPPT